MSQIRLFAIACSALAALVLAACGGGGGNGSGGGGGGPVPPTPIATATLPTTTASGTVIDDSTGVAKPAVKVVLRPWTACAIPTPTSLSCPTPLPAPQATTAADGSFTLANAPNGHYFLVIGDDTPGSHTTTVHANVTLVGGTIALVAPNMPPIPTFTPPVTELSGKYRIRALDPAKEVPCIDAFNALRVSHGNLPQLVPDEWLLENIIGWNANRLNGSPSSPPWPGNANGIFAATLDTQSGGTLCSTMPAGAFFLGSQALDARVQWYGGSYTTLVYGADQWIADPTTLPLPTGVIWP